MSYPISPFPNNFDVEILRKIRVEDAEVEHEREELNKLLRWLCTSPSISTLRINSLKCTAKEIFLKIKEQTKGAIAVEISPHLSETIILHNINPQLLDLDPKGHEVIVDLNCAIAVLRGAHVFAPGVMGMHSAIKVGDHVSIYADLENNCRKGLQKTFDSPQKLFIGNGIARQCRYQLFGQNLNPRGVAIEVYSNISGCLLPDLSILSEGTYLLQNLPSIICARVLNPQPGECVLDMCAAPGNKTTHIAALMKNEGTIIAIDKTPGKVSRLKENCKAFGADVIIYKVDSTKIFHNSIEQSFVGSGPPFGSECFDRILLDAPCSALGKRPQLYNNSSEKVLKSYVPLQRKLFTNAVHLLKVNGHLAYSTCTVTQAENEALVAWALNTYKCLKLVEGKPHLGGKGWATEGLTEGDLRMVQRFGPEGDVDSVGFFIALFTKVYTVL